MVVEPFGVGVRRPRVTFIYLGTANEFARFVCELARASEAFSKIQAAFIVAADRPLSAELSHIGVETLCVPGVNSARPMLFLRRYFQTRKAVISFLAARKPDLVITLMPHVWSPALTPAIKQHCGAYATIIHDAVPHPGDSSGWVTPWLLRDAQSSDLVVTLSKWVAEELTRGRRISRKRIVSLYHPHLSGDRLESRRLEPGSHLRLLLFGRIMRYKGLPLLIDAVELLKDRGISIALGVAGAGNIGRVKARLEALGAEIINRTLTDSEVSALLARYQALACSHLEASQSGVAALAFGNCMPVVATPVGGLSEQVITGRTGVLATQVTAVAFADAIQDLVSTPGLYDAISQHLKSIYHCRSMDAFLDELVSRTVEASSNR